MTSLPLVQEADTTSCYRSPSEAEKCVASPCPGSRGRHLQVPLPARPRPSQTWLLLLRSLTFKNLAVAVLKIVSLDEGAG